MADITKSRIKFDNQGPKAQLNGFLRIDSSGATDNYFLEMYENGAQRFRVYENSSNVYFDGGAGNTHFRPRQMTLENGNSSTASFRITTSHTTYEQPDSNGYSRFTAKDGSAQIGMFRSNSSVGGGYIGGDETYIANFYTSGFSKKAKIYQNGNFHTVGDIDCDGVYHGDGSSLDNILPKSKYLTTNTVGFLIKTNIIPTDYAMFTGTLKLEQFNVGTKQTIEFSATTINNGTVHVSKGTADKNVTIKLFVYDSKWYIWCPTPSTYTTISAYIGTHNSYQGQSNTKNEVNSISIAAVPSSGVTGSVDINCKFSQGDVIFEGGVAVDDELDINGTGASTFAGHIIIDDYTVGSNGSQSTYADCLTSFASGGNDHIYLGLKNGSYPNRGYAFQVHANGVNSDFVIKEHGLNGERFRINTAGTVNIPGVIDGPFTALRLANQKTYGSGTGTNETVRFAMGISESGYALSTREGFVIESSVADQSDSSNVNTEFKVRDGGIIGTAMKFTGSDKTVDFYANVTTTSDMIASRFKGRVYPYNTIVGHSANATTTTVLAGSTSATSIELSGGDVDSRIRFYTPDSSNNENLALTLDTISRATFEGSVVPKKGLAHITTDGMNSGTAAWRRLGILKMSQSGRVAEIKVYAGSGYNANIDQQAHMRIQIRTSNGSTTQSATQGSAVKFSGYYTQYGPQDLTSAPPRVEVSGTDEYTIYMYTKTFIGASPVVADVSYGSTFEVKADTGGSSTDFTSSNYLELPERNFVRTETRFADQVSVGTGSAPNGGAMFQVVGSNNGAIQKTVILGNTSVPNGTTNSMSTAPRNKTLLTGYSIPYTGNSNAALAPCGFLQFDSAPGWTGNQRDYAITSGFDTGGTGGNKLAIIRGNAQNVDPELGDNGGLGTNTNLVTSWNKDGTIYHPGNIGIGKDQADKKLCVYHPTKNNTLVKLESYLATANGSTYQDYSEMRFVANSSGGAPAGIRHYANLWQNSDSALAFWTSQHGGSYAERMRIDGDGFVGINTNAPTNELHVEGKARITGGLWSKIGVYTDGGTYTNQWQKVLSVDYASNMFGFSGFVLNIMQIGATNGAGAHADIHVHFKFQSNNGRLNANIINYGETTINSDHIAIRRDHANLKIELYHKVTTSYTRPYYLVKHNSTSVTWYNTVTGNDTALAATTDNGFTELNITNGFSSNPTNGDATFAGDVVAFSDKKLKKNIKTLDGSKVYDMRGVSFTRKDTKKEGSGVIAQEMQKIAPELVNESSDGTLGVSYGNITSYLIEAIKDLKKEVEELKKQIK